jgi:hypothetical protein
VSKSGLKTLSGADSAIDSRVSRAKCLFPVGTREVRIGVPPIASRHRTLGSPISGFVVADEQPAHAVSFNERRGGVCEHLRHVLLAATNCIEESRLAGPPLTLMIFPANDRRYAGKCRNPVERERAELSKRS